MPISTPTDSRNLAELGRKVISRTPLDRNEGLFLAQLGDEELDELFFWAQRIRREFVGTSISLCGIASARTGVCSENCRFCAQSAHYQTDIQTDVMTIDQIVAAAEQVHAAGARCFGLVASGLGPSDADIETLAPAIQAITSLEKMTCCASLGCLSPRQARRLAQLGVRRYHHNLETSAAFFPQICTTHEYERRVETIKAVQSAGMEVCCGGVLGLGETPADWVDLALLLRELDVTSVPLNFLTPVPGTPLAERPLLPPRKALQIISLYRFMLPDKQLRIAGGRLTVLRDLQSWIFLAGADGCMIGNYLTTAGRQLADDRQMLTDLGLIESETK